MTTPRPLALSALPGFADDVRALPTRAAQIMAMDHLNLVRNGQLQGEPLGNHDQTGDLSDCFKLYFDPDGSGKPRFRLVYRLRKNGLEAVGVEAVAVGQRASLAVYRDAASRLGR